MSTGVEFEEDSTGLTQKIAQQRFEANREPNSKMIRWLMRKGIVKTEGGGRGLLLLLVIINLVISFIVITYFT